MSIEIGLISDTHGFLDPQVAKAFADVDEIWHAGDFGSIEIAQQLAEIKPLRGVYGNIDDPVIREGFDENHWGLKKLIKIITFKKCFLKSV